MTPGITPAGNKAYHLPTKKVLRNTNAQTYQHLLVWEVILKVRQLWMVTVNNSQRCCKKLMMMMMMMNDRCLLPAAKDARIGPCLCVSV